MQYLVDDPAYQELAHDIDEVDLSNRVKLLKQGDEKQVDPIVRQLIRVTVYLTNKYHYKGSRDELIGEALLALVKSVQEAKEKLLDEDIKSFVFYRVHRAIKGFIQSNHILSVPSRTLRHLRSQGIEVNLPKRQIYKYEHDVLTDKEDYIPSKSKPIYSPFLTEDSNTVDCEEILEKIIESDREREVVELRKKGLTDKKVAEKMNVSRVTVLNTRQELKQRYHDYLKELDANVPSIP